MFDNARDANQYLSNTVCYWDGEPVLIEMVGNNFNGLGYKIPIKRDAIERIEVDVRDMRFNCRLYQLGYMNSERMRQAIYVTRRPSRGLAQGINGHNLRFQEERLSMDQVIRDEGFKRMLMGQYPERNEIADRMSDKTVISVAVSPFVAIKRHATLTNLLFLECKGREVSFSETLEFLLPTEFEYLRETCAPVGVLRAA